MVKVAFHPSFERRFRKIKDQAVKEKILKALVKIREDPETGKPMMHNRKGTRELYVAPHRLSYMYFKEDERVLIFDLYHKDEQ
ncbi:MAG TPA: type II toxin-antitoxin system RelE/ParE family toxin [Candidatus Nanoarchaeia archaeon]|nr:type II toxin-antitoxin system RelE/ParE family toxin [Candidatus Nanoarchaeia archaeon]